ncbi:hypothetical protein NPIL_105381 [Nephila pilipes]|uniref:Uncharacterized protein n=1 Tax=Nephila pilipes TaxID=299642 RepID=A0A8X6UQY9_NEPPI|nr:hypothetical protein NPIL_105381 [Nephila pilipes]
MSILRAFPGWSLVHVLEKRGSVLFMSISDSLCSAIVPGVPSTLNEDFEISPNMSGDPRQKLPVIFQFKLFLSSIGERTDSLVTGSLLYSLFRMKLSVGICVGHL